MPMKHTTGSSADDSATTKLPTPDAEDKFVPGEADLSNFYVTLDAKLLAHTNKTNPGGTTPEEEDEPRRKSAQWRV